MSDREHLTPAEAREWLRKMMSLSIGRGKIEVAAKRLGVEILDAAKDDDLVVILAEECLGR